MLLDKSFIFRYIRSGSPLLKGGHIYQFMQIGNNIKESVAVDGFFGK
jgi:hypothetical protein